MDVSVWEVYQLCTDIKYVVDMMSEDTEVIPDELVEVLETWNDGEISNDLEVALNDLNTKLMYNEDVTALSEISQRLEVIDTRLDREFIAINDCYSFLCTLLLCFVSFKFLNWLVRSFSV